MVAEAIEKPLSDRLSRLQLIAGVAAALVGAGVASTLFLNRLATKDDVTASVAAFKTGHDTDRVSVTHRVDDHEDRLRKVEETAVQQRADSKWIKRALHALTRSKGGLGLDAPPTDEKEPL